MQPVSSDDTKTDIGGSDEQPLYQSLSDILPSSSDGADNQNDNPSGATGKYRKTKKVGDEQSHSCSI